MTVRELIDELSCWDDDMQVNVVLEQSRTSLAYDIWCLEPADSPNDDETDSLWIRLANERYGAPRF